MRPGPVFRNRQSSNITPPRGLYHPVLPYRSNGKLKFPLCQTCAENENPSPFACSDEDRAMTGTWCTPELETAVRLGYQVLKIYAVYHWKVTTRYDPETKEGGLVCKTTDCPKTEEPVTCQKCHMTCRSEKCYQRHSTKQKGRSECETWWKCTTCYKVINTTKREKEDHRCGEYHCTSCEKYVMRDHLCYLRSIPAKEEFIPKFIFADFECSQDERAECTEGYIPLRNPDCMECQPGRTCTLCSTCQRCKMSWCGKATNKPNFVVAHTVCPTYIDRPVTSKSTYQDCGTRCSRCEDQDAPCGRTGHLKYVRKMVIFEST